MPSTTATNLEKFISQDLPYLKLLPKRITPNALLDHIIDILVHPTPTRRDWLMAIGRRGGNPDGTRVGARDLITLGAAASVSKELVVEVIAAVARADGLGWSPATVGSVVEYLYGEYHRHQRAEELLPTLEVDPTPATDQTCREQTVSPAEHSDS